MSFSKPWRIALGKNPANLSGPHSTTDALFSVSSEADMPINFIKGIASSHKILLQRKLQRITKRIQTPKFLVIQNLVSKMLQYLSA